MGGNMRPVGAQGEDLACDWLAARGYRVLERNFSTRSGEVDIVAMDGDVLCFVEVKALRDPPEDVVPEMVVTARKRGRILRAARAWIAERRLAALPCRFDVVGITIRRGVPEVRLSRAAFDGSSLPPSLR